MVTRRAALSVKILRQSNNCCLRHIGNQGINQIVALPGNVGQTIEGAYVRHAIRYILAISAISGCLLAEAGNDIEGEEIIVASIHVGRDAPVHEEAKPTTYQVEIGDRRAWWRREQDLTGEPASKRIGIACGDIERPTTIDERAQLVDRGFCNLQSARRWILVEQNDTRRREQQNQGEHSQQSEPAGNPRIDSASPRQVSQILRWDCRLARNASAHSPSNSARSWLRTSEQFIERLGWSCGLGER